MTHINPEMSGSVELWQDFCRVETPEGRTFDPLEYMLACRREDPAPILGATWYQIYTERPHFLAGELTTLLRDHYIYLKSVDDVEVMTESVRHIAESLSDPMGMPVGKRTRWKATLLHDLFWALHSNADYQKLPSILGQGKDCFSEEDEYYMSEALRKLETE